MKNMKLLSLLIRFVSISLALTSVTTVHAAPPDVHIFHDEGSTLVADCGNFLAIEDFTVDVRETTYFDRDGNPVRMQVHVNFNGVLTNSVTGLTLRDNGNNMFLIDLQEGTVATLGLFFGITVPGEGIAILDAGNVIFDADGNVIFEGGPHQFLAEGPALICAALD